MLGGKGLRIEASVFTTATDVAGPRRERLAVKSVPIAVTIMTSALHGL